MKNSFLVGLTAVLSFFLITFESTPADAANGRCLATIRINGLSMVNAKLNTGFRSLQYCINNERRLVKNAASGLLEDAVLWNGTRNYHVGQVITGRYDYWHRATAITNSGTIKLRVTQVNKTNFVFATELVSITLSNAYTAPAPSSPVVWPGFPSGGEGGFFF